MMSLPFVKVQGTGNDFVLLDCLERPLPEQELPGLARLICHRRFGVGSDGLILVLPSGPADYRMRMFNPDGSEAEMCGNGIRCFALYLHGRGLAQESVRVETLAGIISPQLLLRDGRVEAVRVDMGQPRLLRSQVPMLGPEGRVLEEELQAAGQTYRVTCLSMGNPHCVTFVEELERFPVGEIGPAIEHHPSFPARTNVEFVQALSPAELRMRVWERGAGETLACGTGACATLVAAALTGRAGRRAAIHLDGGDLQVDWTQDDHLLLEGPAQEVFRGEIELVSDPYTR